MAVRRQINLTTTGTLSPVVFSDLGRRRFTHPTIGFDLLEEYSHDKLTKSLDLQDAIDNGHVILKDENGVVLNSIELLNILNNFENASPTVNDDADQGYSIGSNWVNTTTNELYICVDNTVGAAIWIKPVTNAASFDAVIAESFGRDNNVSNAYLDKAGSVPSNLSPFVLPFDVTLVAISAATNGPENWAVEVKDESGVTYTGATLAVMSDSGYSGSYSIDFSAGDKITVYCNGTSVSRPTATLFFKRR